MNLSGLSMRSNSSDPVAKAFLSRTMKRGSKQDETLLTRSHFCKILQSSAFASLDETASIFGQRYKQRLTDKLEEHYYRR